LGFLDPSRGQQTGESWVTEALQGFLVECDRFGNSVAAPGVDDPDLPGNELDTVEPQLEVAVSVKPV